MKKQPLKLLIVPLVAAIAFTSLYLVPQYKNADRGVFDLFLAIKPTIPEDTRILLLDIDDLSIAQVGVFPWSRDIMADGLIALREFDAAYAVFDIEYVDRSPSGINSEYLNRELPAVFGQEFTELRGNVEDLFRAIIEGYVPVAEAGQYVDELLALAETTEDDLLAAFQQVTRDNDAYLKVAAQIFGTAFFTINMRPYEEGDSLGVNEDRRTIARERIALQATEIPRGAVATALDIKPTILPVMEGGRGAGFPNVVIDPDGVRRRVDVVTEHAGSFYAQLATRPVLHWLGDPVVAAEGRSIVFRDAQLPGTTTVTDIRIPLGPDGRMLINWPKKSFIDSFRHLSYYELVRHKRLFDNLAANLAIMDDERVLGTAADGVPLIDYLRYAEGLHAEMLATGDGAAMAEYRDVRDALVDELTALFESGLQQSIAAEIASIIEQPGIDAATHDAYRELGDYLDHLISETAELTTLLATSRAKLSEQLQGSFVIIGFIGTGTTDIGVNPFESEYPNVGTHASVANTILQQRFLVELPVWLSGLAALVLSLLVGFGVNPLKPLTGIVVGMVIVAAVFAGGLALFLLTGAYLPMLGPIAAVFVTFFALSLMKFIETEQEKGFLRKAFGQYLSGDVISDLLANPDKLRLGGEKRTLTAVFTDVKGFSTISEALDPSDLVQLLNLYLTDMSNTILDLRGTIDKYEGDAIISFFGAPVELPDHPLRACSAAVRMKKTEAELNTRFLRDKLSPVPLLTRIGMNTGEMVVGNMGTPNKMDYTIMGNSVNLAARLEGVNKQYGTWIMISEATKAAAGSAFLVRPLDRVRVVGINTAVRLYELIDEVREAGPAAREGIALFEQAIELFEQRQWQRAAQVFENVRRVLPDDKPSEIYLKRCAKYQQEPPPAGWDGVYNLSEK